MNLLLALPLELRLIGLTVLGACLGSLLNLAVYRWAWHKRSISPWSAPPPKAPPRRLSDRVPVWGWFGLRREVKWHGRGFWMRPLLVELGCGVGLAWLYWWETVRLGLLPELPPGMMLPAEVTSAVHWQFFSHAVLIALMIIASLIDIDEKLIPDEVTVSGTLLGLGLAALVPFSLLPTLDLLAVPPHPELAILMPLPAHVAAMLGPDNAFYFRFLTLTSPQVWPAALEGRPQLASLAIGLGCYWLWCFAILPRPWYARHGWRRAMAVSTSRMFRRLRSPVMLLLVALGTLGIVGVWGGGGGNWAGLLTALVGMAGGGGMIWAVRLIGRVTLRKEAMGFGDVMLMMMIGPFVGWQTSIMIFFMAPFAGLLIGVIQYILRRDQTIPYGPFLCLATWVTLVGWASVWERAEGIFFVSWLVPAVIVACLAVMTVMLLLLRIVREALFGQSK